AADLGPAFPAWRGLRGVAALRPLPETLSGHLRNQAQALPSLGIIRAVDRFRLLGRASSQYRLVLVELARLGMNLVDDEHLAGVWLTSEKHVHGIAVSAFRACHVPVVVRHLTRP